MRSGPSLWTYLVLLIQSGILPCSWNSLPIASKANSTHGFLTSSTGVLSKQTCGCQWNPFISSPCRGWSAPRQCSVSNPIPDLQKCSIWLWKSCFISILMNPSLSLTSLILQTGRLQFFPLFRPWQNHKLLKHLEHLSILTNLTFSPSFSEKTVWQTLLSTF